MDGEQKPWRVVNGQLLPPIVLPSQQAWLNTGQSRSVDASGTAGLQTIRPANAQTGLSRQPIFLGEPDQWQHLLARFAAPLAVLVGQPSGVLQSQNVPVATNAQASSTSPFGQLQRGPLEQTGLASPAFFGAENALRPTGTAQSTSAPVFSRMMLSNVLTDSRFRPIDTIASAFG
jgi:hypothetical protein